MCLAALILLAGVVSFFLATQEEARQAALQSIADRAAALVDGVSGMDGEVASALSLGPGGSLELPELAAGETYSLTLYRSYVVTGFDGRRAFATLQTPLHLWEPHAVAYTAANVSDLDARHPSMTLQSGGIAILSRRSVIIDGTTTLETFAFP